MDAEFDVDDDFLAALASADTRTAPPQATRQFQPPPPFLSPKIQQPTPQRLDKAPSTSNTNASSSSSATPKIVQPTPQALPSRSSGSSILVSPRQKGNPVLANIRSMPWEYSDILPDYGLGLTTCALFLSLKYHRLHPEYIYQRIKKLQGKYNLRILLTMVDIPNHEDSLRELSKTSLVNNVTVILCWSAAEAARYLELYKSYEHASFTAIRGTQATSYAEKLVEFVTVPRNINKADAVSLVGSFGSLRNAVNADREQVSVVNGWGERKVNSWCRVVEQPFRVKKTAKKSAPARASQAVPIGRVPAREISRVTASGTSNAGQDVDDEEAEALMAATEGTEQTGPSAAAPVPTSGRKDEHVSEGIAAALAKFRSNG
ncbi:restriction endonuclease type II-like protein [Podospora fimiseda]|uniref:Restriction endonuclease type II-like protein n=1 Tax=Podospora fimiseda TaxID=252190 RepID=A0AAN7H8K8_9PEZI|nr:restriction endonuclease type II-like protein [Podospora fimiseda]